MNKHVVFIGFKNVGKSVIAMNLAGKIHEQFIDLDHKIELLSEKRFSRKLSCREIMQTYGEKIFRDIETEALHYVIKLDSCVIALGGGTLSRVENQILIKTHFIIHVTTSPGIVFERIMIHGKPAFFSFKHDPIISFKKLWNKRRKVYQKFADLSIENNGPVEETVEKIINQLVLI